MQDVYDEGAFDGLTVVGSVLQNTFGLPKVNEGFAGPVNLDALLGIVIEFDDSFDELIWMTKKILVLVISRSLVGDSSTSLRS